MACPPLHILGLRFLVLFAAAWFWGSPVEGADGEPASPSDHFRSPAGLPQPNVSLPKSVVAAEGKVTLFAEFEDPAGNRLYLVNQTDRMASFASQDGDLGFKLEYLRPDGVWERAQKYAPSFCGNSYFPIELPPGHYLRFVAYSPTHGVKARVRYSSYPGVQMRSNEGEGWVLDDDIRAARADELGLSELPQSIVRILRPDSYLMQPTPAHVTALRLLQVYSDNPKLRANAQVLLDQWEKASKRDADTAKVVSAFRKVLAGPWPKEPSRVALLKYCARALAGGPRVGTRDIGMPEDHLDLVWEVVADIASVETAPDPEIWRLVMAKIPDFSETENWRVQPSISRLLNASAVVDATLPDSFLEEMLQTFHGGVQNSCADALSRRQQWKRLVELGWQLKPEGQVKILRSLASLPTPEPRFRIPREPADEGERAFWRHCMTTQPIKVACELSWIATMQPFETKNPFGRTVHDPLHDFFVRAAALSDHRTRDFDLNGEGNNVSRAVEFLASWDLEEDRDVLNSLLAFRGYERQTSTSPTPEKPVIVHYPVRAAAREALRKSGVPVPGDIILERQLTAAETVR
jgi:hypothetical protein